MWISQAITYCINPGLAIFYSATPLKLMAHLAFVVSPCKDADIKRHYLRFQDLVLLACACLDYPDHICRIIKASGSSNQLCYVWEIILS